MASSSSTAQGGAGGAGSSSSAAAAPSVADSTGTTDNSYRQCLRTASAAVLAEAGFDSSSQAALATLTEALQSFMCELGRSTRAFTELACRNRPLPADVLMALVEMGFRPEPLTEYAFRASRRCLPNPGALQPPKPAAILHTGDRKRHRPGGVIPENFVEFPDSHSYMRTPTHKQPVTDYESVREKAAAQKRDVERALTRFVAKTSKTHSLFATDDVNPFPLIHCSRVPPDQPLLPPYVAALLFKDQVFEEDESEFAPKKKKEDDAKDKKKGKGKASGAAEADDDDDDDENAEDAGKKAKEKEEADVVENPFLKPARHFRNSLPKRT